MYTAMMYGTWLYFAGTVIAFAATIILLKVFADRLPHDQGRAFAVEGTLSKGKARGAGIIFILVFVAADLLTNEFSLQRLIYMIIIVLTMLSGYFDDASEKPWNEYLKGALDFILAIGVAVNYLYFNGNTLFIDMGDGISVTIPYVLFGILIVILVWVAINVTNCTDGVDGLSATLTIITLAGFYIVMRRMGEADGFDRSVFLFMTVLVAYLWYNATPSTILMGDAGSRSMGMMIAIAALMSGQPLLYIPLSAVMIFDGGLGLLKVFFIRFLKVKGFLKNVRCPLHDQARKESGWSNTQVVFRFAIIQLLILAVVLS